ncbi:MAG: energy-coupling factor transport system ATP-binding protein [Clostridia bacterium]|nr:energy-coupling factor transport system ATP-binding protein [Clostridia bacterium]
MLQARQVSFIYPGASRPALAGLDFTLNKGELVALVGPNGSGKSTLARLLNGLLLPREGRVEIEGLDTRDRSALPEIRRRVGLVFQDPDNQLLAGTVEEDVAFGLENLGLEPGEIRRRVQEVMARLGLEELRECPPHRLSGGQKQRVALAGVLVMQPDYIILDEATSMLDPVGRRSVLSIIRELQASLNLGVLLITHLLEESLLADRVVVLHGGRVIAEGPPRAIFLAPEKLAMANLEIPEIVQLAERLRRAGLPLNRGLANGEEMAEELWRLKLKM